MSEKEAIITPKGEVRCPYCGLLCAKLTGGETIMNFRMRCRGSRRDTEHYFMLNVMPKTAGKEAV